MFVQFRDWSANFRTIYGPIVSPHFRSDGMKADVDGFQQFTRKSTAEHFV